MALLALPDGADGVADGVDNVNGVDDAGDMTLVEAAMLCHPWLRDVAAVAPLLRRETGVSEWSNV